MKRSHLHPNDRITGFQERLQRSPKNDAQAAVAVLLRRSIDDVELFLVKRAEVAGDPWSGDMAFPGGKKGPEDSNLFDTAVRETVEETGIDLKDIEILGYMETFYSSVGTNLAVQPIVFHYTEDSEIHLNYELTRYVWVPMKDFVKSKTHAIIKGWDTPIYRVEGEVVWGLTFKMLERLFELIEES
ncbi:MAG: CoA pyrophosphatase [Candidatus Bathyarchaeota archaeon]|nr:CoA pyrophosphatase [Candidatus Bathyarchaeota archaeon]